jgi:hypothetical protein
MTATPASLLVAGIGSAFMTRWIVTREDRLSIYSCNRGDLDPADASHSGVARGAPAVDRFGCGGERARLPRTGFEELLHPVTVFKRNPICVEEIQEDAARCRMLSRSVDYRRALCSKPVQSTTDVVNFRDHEVDVMEHWTPTTYHSDAVMKGTGIRTHERQCFRQCCRKRESSARHDRRQPLRPLLGVYAPDGKMDQTIADDQWRLACAGIKNFATPVTTLSGGLTRPLNVKNSNADVVPFRASQSR